MWCVGIATHLLAPADCERGLPQHHVPTLPPQAAPNPIVSPRSLLQFFVYNSLNEALPQYSELPKRLLRSAFIGFCASAVSGASFCSLHGIACCRGKGLQHVWPLSPPVFSLGLLFRVTQPSCSSCSLLPAADTSFNSICSSFFSVTHRLHAVNQLNGCFAHLFADTCSNSIRVVKTTKQAATDPISYTQAVKVR